jgi:transposase
MDHVAIDLGGRKSQICRRSSSGEILEEKQIATLELGLYLAYLTKSVGVCRVVLETCAEAFHVADQAIKCGHQVRVVSGTLVKTLGVGSRRTKNDKRDARVLSEVSCRIELPSVHIPSDESRKRKTMSGMRDALVSSRTQLINTVRGWMRGQAIQVRGGGTKTFPARMKEKVQELAIEFPPYVTRQLTMIEMLTEQIAEADRELKKAAVADPVCQRLMTVPGVGPVTAIIFTAVIDQVGRFSTAHEVESYLGLVPGENSSSEKKQRTSITKAGSTRVRRVLVQAAWAAQLCRTEQPIHVWFDHVASRRGKRIAAVATARKLAGILYAVWRDGTTYDPERASAMRRIPIEQAVNVSACGRSQGQAA